MHDTYLLLTVLGSWQYCTEGLCCGCFCSSRQQCSGCCCCSGCQWRWWVGVALISAVTNHRLTSVPSFICWEWFQSVLSNVLFLTMLTCIKSIEFQHFVAVNDGMTCIIVVTSFITVLLLWQWHGWSKNYRYTGFSIYTWSLHLMYQIQYVHKLSGRQVSLLLHKTEQNVNK